MTSIRTGVPTMGRIVSNSNAFLSVRAYSEPFSALNTKHSWRFQGRPFYVAHPPCPSKNNAVTFAHLRSACPRVPGNVQDERGKHSGKHGLHRFLAQAIGLIGRNQWSDVREKAGIGELGEHPLLGLRPRYHEVLCRKIEREDRSNTRLIQLLEHPERM